MTALTVSFALRLANDPDLRDVFVAHLDEQIAAEVSIDRIDDKHSLDHQRGAVATLRRLRQSTMALERPKEPIV